MCYLHNFPAKKNKEVVTEVHQLKGKALLRTLSRYVGEDEVGEDPFAEDVNVGGASSLHIVNQEALYN